MKYPLISEYIDAIKNSSDNLYTLTSLEPVLDSSENPIMSSGNFAVVFKMLDKNTGQYKALKCFTRDQAGRSENYRLICEELSKVDNPYIVKTEFFDREFFVPTSFNNNMEPSECTYPVLLMDWVDGESLKTNLERLLLATNINAIEDLCGQFSQLSMWLFSQPFAHGDLKPDNILITADKHPVLVDYDGMYVPAMKGQRASELGSPNFRHPYRTLDDFDEHIDDFSLVSILISLKAISFDVFLYDQRADSEGLLLCEKDSRNFFRTTMTRELMSIDDEEISRLLACMYLVINQKSLCGLSREMLRVSDVGVDYSENKTELIRANDRFNYHTYYIKEGVQSINSSAFEYKSCLNKVFIPSSVTIIGSYAFLDCKSLSDVALSSSLKSIKRAAFMGCSNLRDIELPSTTTSIGNAAFLGCSKLSSITLPQSLAHLGDGAFASCISLQSAILPNSIAELSPSVFSGCTSLKRIALPTSITYIASGMFSSCSNLEEIVIPSSVTCIEESAFFSCSKLHTIHIPSSVKSIGAYAFLGCQNITSIKIPSSVTTIGKGAFASCSNLAEINVDHNPCYKIKSGVLFDNTFSKLICFPGGLNVDHYSVPDTVLNIMPNAFDGCIYLKEIEVSLYVNSIGVSAFRGCSNLSKITISSSVKNIDAFAFEECSNLKKIVIPSSVITIGKGPFASCSKLTEIIIDQNPSYTVMNGVLFDKNMHKLICFPGGLNKEQYIIPDTVSQICSLAFAGSSFLKEIVIPSSVNYIDLGVFDNCTNLERVIVPKILKMRPDVMVGLHDIEFKGKVKWF